MNYRFQRACEAHRNMSAEVKKEIQLEMAHVLFTDMHHRWKVSGLLGLKNEVAKEELSRSGMTSTGCLRDLKHDQLRNTSQSG